MSIFKEFISVCLIIGTVTSLSGCNVTRSGSNFDSSEILTESKIEQNPNTSIVTRENAKIEETLRSTTTQAILQTPFSISEIEMFNGKPYTIINDNTPYFAETDITSTSFEYYSPLDTLGRCGVAFACIGQDIMPAEERGSIGMIKPSAWHLVKYDNIDGKYLYNRCHLIGYQLSGENANEQNLITGTRYLNIQGMLPFENMVADYVKETYNHVLYRVTPVFDGDNLLANGVLMEGFSVEDNGEGICFNVFCYNVQPDISINYANGDSERLVVTTEQATQEPVTVPEVTEDTTPQAVEPVEMDYIINTNTGKFHYPSCSSVNQMAEHNKMAYTGNRDDLITQGYEPCKRCNP